MSMANKFRKSALKLFSLFGNTGTLIVPLSNGILDTVTGDVTQNTRSYPISYINSTLDTAADSDFGLAAFKESRVTFYVSDISVVVNETCSIVDLNGVKWDIISLNTVKTSDLVIVYEAVIKAHV